MKSKLSYIACAIAVIYLFGCKKDTDTNSSIDRTLSKMDISFMNQASSFNNSELAGVNIAGKWYQNGSLIYYTGHLYQDEYNRQADLQMWADIFGITIPNSPDSAHVALFYKLQSYPQYSHAFDTAYMNSQVIDQGNAVDLYQQEVNAGTNKNLRDYANKYLPQVMLHKHWADSISLKLQ